MRGIFLKGLTLDQLTELDTILEENKSDELNDFHEHVIDEIIGREGE